MLTGYFDGNGNELKIGDKWEYLNVIYTVIDDGNIYFEHPSHSARSDDNIEIEHSWRGEVVAK
ncbi:hypothetical protein [Oceanobacillus timonensis]|uniref:hypothetical protein n=1 Tax=Oceanobacillus timonensis TaxID=1926285 RepID=UPI0009BA7CFB|nr:hypothetical protein [Oceanobacillus timonensis]